ncbi:methylenetetrahydrofolate reductase [Fodinicurvata sp. EGI_FJ10296]|uniref:methylenetetrahydrofolate reductase n=1 Tax=Fodinicurvata sp. EGI_FJ10296 TaxID=3231908 RepID=UPI003454461B
MVSLGTIRAGWGSASTVAESFVVTENERIRSFLDGTSIETLPAVAAKTDCFRALVPQGTAVYIACIPGTDPNAMIATARRLSDEGLVPVPHLPSRGFESLVEFERYLGRLVEEAGVTRVLALGGDADRPAGPFTETMDMLRTGLFQRFGIGRIGVAGHPDGNRAIPANIVARALADKQAFADETGIDVHIVTQFSFDPDRIVAWDRSLRASGIRLPIHIGMAGPAKLQSLIKYAAMCGVATSARMFSKQAFNLARMASVSAPDQMTRALATYRAEDPDAGIVGAHLFTFGGLRRAADWLEAARAGEFSLTRDGFTVERSLG